MSKKVIITGSRRMNDFEFMESTLNELYPYHDIEIVHGDGDGADQLANQYGTKFNLKIHRFPAQWLKYGKAAGPLRNTQMAEFCTRDFDECVGFPDNKSIGTIDMINKARKRGLKTYVK